MAVVWYPTHTESELSDILQVPLSQVLCQIEKTYFTLSKAHTLKTLSYSPLSYGWPNRIFCRTVPENVHEFCEQYAILPCTLICPEESGSSLKMAINNDVCRQRRMFRINIWFCHLVKQLQENQPWLTFPLPTGPMTAVRAPALATNEISFNVGFS